MIPGMVKNATGRAGGVKRYFLSNLERHSGHWLRSSTTSHSYRIPDTVRIISASSAPPTSNSRSAGSAATKCPDDHYSQMEISPATAAARWGGVAVRIRDDGQEAYVGIYKTDHSKSELMLCKRTGGKWTRLGRTYRAGPLADGTRLKLVALGSTVAFMENDLIRIVAGDSSLSNGVPGIVVNGTEAAAGELSVGPASYAVHHLDDDSRGIATYQVISATNSGGPRLLRVLRPERPRPEVAHNLLFVLPVEDGLKSVYGDGLHELHSLDVQNEYNVTIIEPSFGIEPWYADNPDEPDVRHETFMVRELVPWSRATLAITGDEQSWLLGFSKSGIGGQVLLLRHPGLFDLAASWDFPADISTHDEYGSGSAACYGTDANFQTNYRLTSQFVDAHRAPFLRDCRIWIGRGSMFTNSVSRYESILAAAGVRCAAGATLDGPHRWDGGWLPAAMAALRECSAKLSGAAACDT